MSGKLFVSVVIPVFNEEEGIAECISSVDNELKKAKVSYEIIIVNDCSTDRTGQILSHIKGIKVVNHIKNHGYGASIKSGIKEAKGDWILITDADGTYSYSAVPELIKETQNYDMVIGARIKKGAKIPLLRRPAKFFIKKLAEYLSGAEIPDINSGLRIFNKEIAHRFMTLFPDGFSFTVTITISSIVNGYNIKYVPVDYKKRKGKSSIKPLRDFFGFISLVVRLITYFKPLNVFLPIAVILFIIGFTKAARDFVLVGQIGPAGVITILASFQIAFLGLLADLIIKRTRL